MQTEIIDLTIGGIDFYQSIVEFGYSAPESGSLIQPYYPESLTINKVQLEIAPSIWANLQEDQHFIIERQVLEFIHAKQELLP